jgi:hypothetical protein
VVVLATFNANFYITGATVIPVLFIALMLPDGILVGYALWTRRVRTRWVQSIAGADRSSLVRSFLASTRMWLAQQGFFVIQLPMMFALIFGLTGEVAALLALDEEQATRFEHVWVRASVIGLVALLAVGAMIWISWERTNEPSARG